MLCRNASNSQPLVPCLIIPLAHCIRCQSSVTRAQFASKVIEEVQILQADSSVCRLPDWEQTDCHMIGDELQSITVWQYQDDSPILTTGLQRVIRKSLNRYIEDLSKRPKRYKFLASLDYAPNKAFQNEEVLILHSRLNGHSVSLKQVRPSWSFSNAFNREEYVHIKLQHSSSFLRCRGVTRCGENYYLVFEPIQADLPTMIRGGSLSFLQ